MIELYLLKLKPHGLGFNRADPHDIGLRYYYSSARGVRRHNWSPTAKLAYEANNPRQKIKAVFSHPQPFFFLFCPHKLFVFRETPIYRQLQTTNAMSAIPSRKLNTGAEIPLIGLGTWQSDKGLVRDAVFYALTETPVRHIDAAYVYQNEEEVGQGINDAIATGKVTRAEIFVTTKVFNSFHDKVQESIDASLKNLNLDYVDLLLMHWPIGFNSKGSHPLFPKNPVTKKIDLDPEFSVYKTWKRLEAVYKSGKAKAIGVSNFSVPVLQDLLSQDIEVVPAANQLESHPFLPGPEITAFCEEKGIIIEAYSPLGSTGAPLLDNPVIVELAGKYNTTPASILVSWHVNEGRVVLPKSVTPARIKTNAEWVKIDSADLATLDKLSEVYGLKRVVKPDWGVDLKFPDWTDASKL